MFDDEPKEPAFGIPLLWAAYFARHNQRMSPSQSRRRTSSGRVLHMTSPKQMSELQKLIGTGPITYVLVYSVTCPHCHTYKPIWSELCRMKDKRANMVSMEAQVYDKTPLSEQKQVSGVPTVLYVDKAGQISEVSEPRNREVMSNAIKLGVPESVAASNIVEPAVPVSKAPSEESAAVSSNLFRVTAPPSSPSEVAANVARRVATPIPGTQVSESKLHPLPAMQSGGNPWSAFISVARQAAPAAVLLGAYAMSRSSGLGRSTIRNRRHRSLRRHSFRRRR